MVVEFETLELFSDPELLDDFELFEELDELELLLDELELLLDELE